MRWITPVGRDSGDHILPLTCPNLTSPWGLCDLFWLPQTRWLIPQKSCPISSGSWKSSFKVPVGLVFGETFRWPSRCVLWACTPVLLVLVSILINSFNLNYCLKGPISNTVTSWVRASTYVSFNKANIFLELLQTSVCFSLDRRRSHEHPGA